MTISAMIWLGMTGAIFALWALQMFRCLFGLLGDAIGEESRRSGGTIPGFAVMLRSFAAFVRQPRYRVARNRLLWLTALLFAVILLRPLVWPLPGPV